MRHRELALKALFDARWQILGFGAALFVMAAVVVVAWPSYRDTLVNYELPPAVQALLGSDLSIGTAAGFLHAEFFSWTPVLLIVYAITQGTGAVAGEESSGTADLLLAQPLRRSEVILQKTIAVVIGASAIVAIGFAGFAVTLPFVDMDIALTDVAVACVNMLPITLFFFGASLWLGTVAPARAHAVGVATGAVTAAYFANTIARAIDANAWLRFASPFYYFGGGEALVRGIDWTHVALLLGSAALFVALAIRTFDRRDVTMGGATELRFSDIVRRALGTG